MQSIKNILADWKRISGFKDRNITFNANNFVLTEYYIKAPEELKKKTILLFSDTHFCKSKFPYSELAEFINSLKAEWIIFAGDLVRYLSYCSSAVDFLSMLKAEKAKLAVLGNWEIKKSLWISTELWNNIYKKSAFQLLANTISDIPPVQFIGLKPDTKSAVPSTVLYRKHGIVYTCLASHSPDTIINTHNPEDLKKINLVLCGHTHGGQIRIPFFGALKTSSAYWKLFEYGHYINKKTQSEMIVTNGIGCTCINYRFLCKPEIVRINFI